MLNVSAADIRESEIEARRQRLTLAHLLRVDESKIAGPSDVMLARRLAAAAREKSVAYDALIREAGHLFAARALWFARRGE